MIRPILLIAVIAACSSNAAAQDAGTPVFRVAMKISGEAAVATEIESWIKHELNLIRDVEITDLNPDYTLNAIAMMVNDKEQAPVGIALTWLSLYHPKGPYEKCSLIEDYRLLTFDQSEIREECQKFIARFDSRSLEPHRKILQKPNP